MTFTVSPQSTRSIIQNFANPDGNHSSTFFGNAPELAGGLPVQAGAHAYNAQGYGTTAVRLLRLKAAADQIVRAAEARLPITRDLDT